MNHTVTTKLKLSQGNLSAGHLATFGNRIF